MTTAVIMQPTYLPWIGYFDLMDRCDIFIFLDSVQFSRRSWQQRNRIKTPQGEQWLTVPVISKGLREQKISETHIDASADFQKKHLAAIHAVYAKAACYKKMKPSFEEALAKPYELLADLNIEMIQWTAKTLGIEKKTLRSSELKEEGKKAELLVSLCQAVGADRYLSAAGSKEYIEEDNLFEKANIELEYHQYEHPVYSQLHGVFLPYLSAIDLMMNEGPERGLGILRQGRRSGAQNG